MRAYPDLRDWFAAPLDERVGATRPRSGERYTCALARPYLYYLAFRGHARFDWPWILAVGYHVVPAKLMPSAVEDHIEALTAEAVRLGYVRKNAHGRLRRTVKYLYLNDPANACAVNDGALSLVEQALDAFAGRSDIETFYNTAQAYHQKAHIFRQDLFILRNILCQRRQIAAPPRRKHRLPSRLRIPAGMEPLLVRYMEARRAQGSRPKTADSIYSCVRHFTDWLMQHHPGVKQWPEVTRAQVLDYAASLDTRPTPERPKPLSIEAKITRLSKLSVFLHDTTAWEWEGAPRRPLIGARDLPKRVTRIPRFIPADQLERIMRAIRKLSCRYQRTALIVARWSGARRGEIRDPDSDCLDRFQDGTPRLRIPAGKTGAERLIPLHEEAADAIRELQSRMVEARGFLDERTGRESRRLFVRHGKRLSSRYLFQDALAKACIAADLLHPNGKPMITAHRFRHTVGTELAEGGARLHTIMQMLGHTSTGMTLVYAHLSDKALREDYLKVLGPGAQIAGPLAETLRSGAISRESLDWLKVNFFRTELELGHCLRLPEEGPCELRPSLLSV